MAFPRGQAYGLTIREYLAAAALQGMLSSGHQDAIEAATIAVGGTAAQGLAAAACGFADALLAELANPEKPKS